MTKTFQRILLMLCCLAAFWIGVACRLSFTDLPGTTMTQEQKDYRWPLIRERLRRDLDRLEKGK